MADAHVFALRVYYEDTDAEGVVYYANYLKFAERARTELLRAHGIEHPALMRENAVAFAVRRIEADYLAPARLDDSLEVVTRLTALRGAAIEGEQTVRRDGRELVRMRLTLACIGAHGRATRLPPRVRHALAAIIPSTSTATSRVHHG
jgi:acyl-CoA thioester hydrolase